jgi:hypothetical protein
MRITYYCRSIVYLVIGVALVLAAGSLDPNHATWAQAAGARHSPTRELLQDEYVPPVGPESVGG